MPISLFEDAIHEYVHSIKLIASFAVLLVFVLLFVLYSNFFITSGSIFLAFNAPQLSSFVFFSQIIVSIIFLALYSFFISLLIFSAKSKAEKKLFYLKDRLKSVFIRLFVFYLIFSLVIILIGVTLAPLGLGLLTALIGLLIALFTFFVPQSIVVDERSLFTSFNKNLEFILSNGYLVAVVFVISFILVAIAPLIEILFDGFMFSGRFFSLLIMLLVFMPLIEIMKTKAYIKKYSLSNWGL